MEQNLTAAKSTIVAFDVEEEQIPILAKKLEGTGVVYTKMESVLHGNWKLIDYVHNELGLGVFADLKLSGTPETLSAIGARLRKHNPEFVSAMCSSGPTAMRALKAALLPGTKLLGVTALTSLTNDDTKQMWGRSVEQIVRMHAEVAAVAEVDGLISAPREIQILRAKYGHRLILATPGIRPKGVSIPGDDQNPERVMTPAQAARAGVDYYIVGRPIIDAEDPHAATMAIIEEIDNANKEKASTKNRFSLVRKKK